MAVAPTCYRVVDVAERWACSTGKIRSMVRSGNLPSFNFKGMIRIPIAAVVAYEARSHRQADQVIPPEAPSTEITAAIIAPRGG